MDGAAARAAHVSEREAAFGARERLEERQPAREALDLHRGDRARPSRRCGRGGGGDERWAMQGFVLGGQVGSAPQ